MHSSLCIIGLLRYVLDVQCSRMYARTRPQRILLRRCVAIIQSLFAAFGSEIAHIVELLRFESQIFASARVSYVWERLNPVLCARRRRFYISEKHHFRRPTCMCTRNAHSTAGDSLRRAAVVLVQYRQLTLHTCLPTMQNENR